MCIKNLENFKFARFRFYLEPKESIYLPPYLGSTLRGGLGNVLKKTVCISSDRDCSRCLLKEKCAYSYIFETYGSETVEASYNLSEYPHPFIIEPPLEAKREYKPGDEIAFNLVLIGKAIDYLPYFVFAYQELGRAGIGKGKGTYTLKKVESTLDRITTVYDVRSGNFLASFQTKSFSDLWAEMALSPAPSTIGLEFLVPTRIKYRGGLTKEIDFQILMRNLLRRILLLCELHCGGGVEIDYNRLLRKAETIKTVQNELRWHDWERWSSRQKTWMKLGGFVGRITFEGDLGEFIPFIRLGEYIHIGKGTSFGLGKYRTLGVSTD